MSQSKSTFFNQKIACPDYANTCIYNVHNIIIYIVLVLLFLTWFYRSDFRYSCGRASPIWDVSRGAMSCGERPHTVDLARPKGTFLVDRDVQWDVSKAAQSTKASERIEQLSCPKVRDEGPFRGAEWQVSSRQRLNSNSKIKIDSNYTFTKIRLCMYVCMLFFSFSLSFSIWPLARCSSSSFRCIDFWRIASLLRLSLLCVYQSIAFNSFCAIFVFFALCFVPFCLASFEFWDYDDHHNRLEYRVTRGKIIREKGKKKGRGWVGRKEKGTESSLEEGKGRGKIGWKRPSLWL